MVTWDGRESFVGPNCYNYLTMGRIHTNGQRHTSCCTFAALDALYIDVDQKRLVDEILVVQDEVEGTHAAECRGLGPHDVVRLISLNRIA